MRYETEVDINRLGSDVSKLESRTEEFRAEFEKLLASIDELNRVWSGQAKEEFDERVKFEAQECIDSIADVKSVVRGMDEAKNEYSKCESAVGTLINRIRV